MYMCTTHTTYMCVYPHVHNNAPKLSNNDAPNNTLRSALHPVSAFGNSDAVSLKGCSNVAANTRTVA